MSKVLVEVYVPSANMTYDAYIPLESKIEEVTKYFSSSINELKQNGNIQSMTILKDSITKNVALAIILWFLGTTIIGIPIVIGIITYRGFCLGYTISTSILTLGNTKGTTFILSSLLLHNIFFIPAIIAIGVSRI